MKNRAATSRRLSHFTVEEQLFQEGYRFEFYQAVRLLEKLTEEAKGILNVPIQIKFFSTVNTAFPASDIQQVFLKGVVEISLKGQRLLKVINLQEFVNVEAPKPLKLIDIKEDVEIIIEDCRGQLKWIELTVQANFMSLAGAHGPLPLPYTELILERAWRKDTTLRDFLDIFNHRLVWLSYRTRKTQRIDLETGAPWQSQFAQYLFALMGLGMPSLRNRMLIDDHPLLFYTGLFVHQSRSFNALRNLLEDFFQIMVRCDPWIGQWQSLSADEWTRLGQNQPDKKLGNRPVLGTRVWDQQSKFALHLGPMGLKQFRDFLPTGTAFNKLRELTRFFVGQELDFEINLILKANEIPETQLSYHQGAPLGWTSWLKTHEGQDNAQVKLLP